MASRRSRIKDIANIPQRRRTAVGVTQDKQKEVIAKSDEKTEKDVEQKQETNTESNNKLDEVQQNENKKESLQEENSVIQEEEITSYVTKPHEITAVSDIKKEISNVNVTESPKNDPCSTTLKTNKENDAAVESKFNITSNMVEEKQNIVKLQQIENTAENATNSVLKTEAGTTPPNLNFKTLTAATSDVYPRKPIFRPNFIKPIISSSVLQRRSRLKLEDETKTSESEGESSVNSKKEVDDKSAAVEQISIKVNSDIAYPPAPPSPSKISRGRIKVVPRLGQRRQSFSASESEDDNRKSNRIRNDSVSVTLFWYYFCYY